MGPSGLYVLDIRHTKNDHNTDPELKHAKIESPVLDQRGTGGPPSSQGCVHNREV